MKKLLSLVLLISVVALSGCSGSSGSSSPLSGDPGTPENPEGAEKISVSLTSTFTTMLAETDYSISWSVTNGDNIDTPAVVEYLSGATWFSIGETTEKTLVWTLPDERLEDVQVRVMYNNDVEQSETSNAFRILKWEFPEALTETLTIGDDYSVNSKIAISANGDAIAVWSQDIGCCYNIYKSEYRNGNWTHPADTDDVFSITSGTDQLDAVMPEVAMNNDGDAVVAWVQYDNAGFYRRLYARTCIDGIWSAKPAFSEYLSPVAPVNPEKIKVSIDNNDNAIIAYQMKSGSYDQIYKSEFRSSIWTQPLPAEYLAPSINYDATNPQVAMDNNGNVVIAWLQEYSPGKHCILKTEYRGSSWTDPLDVTTDNAIKIDGTSNSEHIGLAMSDHGNAIITWVNRDKSSSDKSVLISEYKSNAWTMPTTASSPFYQTGSKEIVTLKVSMNASGDAILAWAENTDASTEEIVYSSIYTASSDTWSNSGALSLDSYIDGEQNKNIAVGIDNWGNAYVFWVQKLDDTATDPDDYPRLFKAQYNGIDSSWSIPGDMVDDQVSVIQAGNMPNCSLPYLSVSPHGDAFVTWKQNNKIIVGQLK